MTTEEPLLKAYLREAVEWGRAFTGATSEHLAEIAEQGDVFEKMVGNPFCEMHVSAMEEHVAKLKVKLEESRAALAFWERLGDVQVSVQVQGGPINPRVLAEARKPSKKSAYAPSLLNIWDSEDHDQAEVEAVAHLASLAECRRWNEAQQ